MSRYYLGLDCSTQSLSVILIETETSSVVYEASLNYSADLKGYGVSDGFLSSTNQGEVHAPPLMWVEALDSLLMKMQSEGCPMSEILAVAGSAQQHGTVYLRAGFNTALKVCDFKIPLHQQLQNIFSRSTSPIWMDSSTAEQCVELTSAFGCNEELIKATGSVAIERFSGAQIKKFADLQPEAYSKTESILLVSNFMTSLFAGRRIGIDYTDASGMNLLDIRTKQWHPVALSSCGEHLQEKLTPAIDPQISLGTLSEYFSLRYGFNTTCKVLPWCGDNPSSIIGLGLIEPGMSAISLGTSDTCFGILKDLPETMNPWAHTFIAPTLDYMSLLCFKNGALARDAIRRKYDLSWEQFSTNLLKSKPGNRGAMMLPWFESEIIPKVNQAGVHRFKLDETDVAANCRAVIEAQMMAMSNHASFAGLNSIEIYATGGGSQNLAILQILADVFACPVNVFKTSNSAVLGAALRAAFSIENKPWNEIVKPYTQIKLGVRILPDVNAILIYKTLKKKYSEFEASLLVKGTSINSG